MEEGAAWVILLSLWSWGSGRTQHGQEKRSLVGLCRTRQ